MSETLRIPQLPVATKPWVPKHLEVWTPPMPTAPVARRPKPVTTPNARNSRHMSTALTAKSLKVAMTLDAAAVQAIPAIDGAVRTIITITVAGRTVSADLATKSIRKAHITLAEHGLNGVVCVLQGKLQGDNTLADAGLAAQVKAQPVAAHSPAAEKAAA